MTEAKKEWKVNKTLFDKCKTSVGIHSIKPLEYIDLNFKVNGYDTPYIPFFQVDEREEMMDYKKPFVVALVNREIKRLTDIANNFKNATIFSAWDIHLILKATYPTISYSDVRSTVNEWFGDSLGWCKTLIELQNGKITNVYHKLSQNPQKYYAFAAEVEDKPEENDSCEDSCGLDGNGCSCGCEECDVCGCSDEDTTSYKDAYADMQNIGDNLADAVYQFVNGEVTLNTLDEALDRYNDDMLVLEKKVK